MRIVSGRTLREVASFVVGAGVLVFEVVTARQGGRAPDLVVLGIGAALMGLTGTSGIDRILGRGAPADPPDDSPSPDPSGSTPPPSTRSRT